MVITILNRPGDSVAPGLGGGRGGTVVSQSDIQPGRIGGGTCMDGKAIISLIQIGQGQGGRGLGDDEGSTGGSLIVGVVEAGGDGIGAGLNGGGRRTVVGDNHPQIGRSCGGGGSLLLAVIGGGEAAQQQGAVGLPNHQRSTGGSAIVGLLDGRLHGITSGCGGGGEGTVVGDLHVQSGWIRGGTDRFGVAVVVGGEAGQRYRGGSFVAVLHGQHQLVKSLQGAVIGDQAEPVGSGRTGRNAGG